MDQERLSAAAVTAAALSLALTEARYVGCTARESTGLMEQTAHKPSRQRAQRRSCRRKGGLWDWGMPGRREAAEGDPPTDEGDESSGKAVCVAICDPANNAPSFKSNEQKNLSSTDDERCPGSCSPSAGAGADGVFYDSSFESLSNTGCWDTHTHTHTHIVMRNQRLKHKE